MKAQGIIDVAGRYTLIDSETGEELIVLDESLSFFVEEWIIRDPESVDFLPR